jgi:hypothetical protein
VAFALDSEGTRREAELAWNDGALTLSLDPRGLVYPVLVDPPTETVVWQKRPPATSPPVRYCHALAYGSARESWRRPRASGGGGRRSDRALPSR